MTITDLTQTWIYAPLPETEADSVQLGRQPAGRDAQRSHDSGQGNRQVWQKRILPRSAT